MRFVTFVFFLILKKNHNINYTIGSVRNLLLVTWVIIISIAIVTIVTVTNINFFFIGIIHYYK